MKSQVTIVNETRGAVPCADFAAIAKEILGPDYILNLVVTSSDKIQKLNLQYRNKNEPTDILSFPLSETEGEIYICPSEVKKEMVKFDRSYENFFVFLFIHGCVHLKGYDHGATMEGIESKIRKQFGV